MLLCVHMWQTNWGMDMLLPSLLVRPSVHVAVVRDFTCYRAWHSCPLLWWTTGIYSDAAIALFQMWWIVHIQIRHPTANHAVVIQMTWFIIMDSSSRIWPQNSNSSNCKSAIQGEAWTWTAVWGVAWKHLQYTNVCKTVNKLKLRLATCHCTRRGDETSSTRDLHEIQNPMSVCANSSCTLSHRLTGSNATAETKQHEPTQNENTAKWDKAL